MDWRDIKYAPRDGTLVLSWDESNPYGVKEALQLVCWERGVWRIHVDGQAVEPTHFVAITLPTAVDKPRKSPS